MAPEGNSHLSQFENTFRERDHEEALLINEFYDQQLDKGQSQAEALDQAATKAEYRLVGKLPRADKLGYETTKRAMRWWNYRLAHDKDLEPGLGEGTKTELAMRRSAVGDELVGGNAFYVAWYALADTARQRKVRQAEKISDIEEHETAAAVNLLLNCFDKLLESGSARKRYKGYVAVHRAVEGPLGPQEITLSRVEGHGVKNYDYAEFSYSPDDPSAAQIVDMTYIFEEAPGRLVYRGFDFENNDVEVEAITMVFLARKITAGNLASAAPRQS